jgi:hypothetical protein
MTAKTMHRLSEGIQLLHLDGFDKYTTAQLENATGINRKTLQRNAEIIEIIDFALSKKGWHQCILHI